jgi:hypothetical protein
MSTAKEIRFEGHLSSSIKPDGYCCYRPGGCNSELLCAGEGECLGVAPRLASTLSRNRFNELAELVRGLTYAEMIEFSGALWRLRGEGKMNPETLPRILHAWATASDRAVRHEPAPPSGAHDGGGGQEFRPIDGAPKDRPILAFMQGQWRIARWKSDPRQRLTPFWSADDLRVTASREHQPKWWTELPPSPPEAAEPQATTDTVEAATAAETAKPAEAAKPPETAGQPQLDSPPQP